MDYFLLELLALLIVLLLLLIVRVIRLRKSRPTEPVTQTEHELQYQMLMQEIQVLQEACDQGHASRKLRAKLDSKREQAQKLKTLITKTIIADVPDHYEAEDKEKTVKQRSSKPINQNAIYLCPKCRKQVLAGDKFCANCGFKLQTKRQI